MARPEVASREELIEAAARILAEEGPGGLSTRRLGRALGVSTMVVYTRFGSMSELMDAVVAEGFDRQATRLESVATTADAAADLVELGVAYQANAVDNPHLYSIMYAGTGDRQQRSEQAKRTFDLLVAAASRVVGDAGTGSGDPAVLAGQVWSAVHGAVTLELAGIVGVAAAEEQVRSLLRRLVSGKG